MDITLLIWCQDITGLQSCSCALVTTPRRLTFGVFLVLTAAGCIIAELITKDPIFKGNTEGGQIFEIFKKLGNLSEQDIEFYSKMVPYEKEIFSKFPKFEIKVELAEYLTDFEQYTELADLLSHMWELDFTKRWDANQCLAHPLFNI